jgi:hypothetical protein
MSVRFPAGSFGGLIRKKVDISTFAGFRFGARCKIRSAGFRRQVSWLPHLFLKIHERGFSGLLLNGFLGKSVV